MYHPTTSTAHYFEPSGVGITNIINRAELAAIAAAITHGYTHIATDSLPSFHQVEKYLLYPKLHRYQVQGDIVYSSAAHLYLYRG